MWPLGTAFLNNVFPLASHMKQDQIQRLNTAACTDLAWWQLLSNNWIGTSVHQFLLLQEPSHHLYTNTSGSWECGAFSLPFWLQYERPRDTTLLSIALKELFLIVRACAVLGHPIRGIAFSVTLTMWQQFAMSTISMPVTCLCHTYCTA